jgi:diguanylate cyclase (GGDEF)-like protein
LRILIADDDAVSRRLLQKTLVNAGYEVTVVENGRLAREELNRPNGPRIALLDWEMPEMDGPTVCREIRKRTGRSYVYILLVTSKEAKAEIVAGLESGADDYLTKPFDGDELKARLRTGLRILNLEDQLVLAREEMRYKATHDPLTSLWNRGVIMELLGRELLRSRREKVSTCIVLADLDHFKLVNDTYGHVIGDEVLREVARRLVASVRPYDFVGRYGGEEFLVVLNNCEPSGALIRGEEIRKSIALRPVVTAGGQLSISLSLGLLISSEWGERPVEDLLNEADKALYAAKEGGRNRVMLARPGVPAKVPEISLTESVIPRSR